MVSVGVPLVKNTTFAFTPWLYGVNVPRGKSQNRVEGAILAQNLEHLASLIREQAVIRQHDGRSAAGPQNSQDVLDEVQLLVAGRDGEVFAVRVPGSRPLVPNGGFVRITSKSRRDGGS